MEDRRETAALMLMRLNCKSCGKELTFKLSPEGKHWRQPIFIVDKCDCLSEREEIAIDDLKGKIIGMKDDFEKAINAIIEHENPKGVAEALLEDYKKWNKIPEVAFVKIPKMINKKE